MERIGALLKKAVWHKRNSKKANLYKIQAYQDAAARMDQLHSVLYENMRFH